MKNLSADAGASVDLHVGTWNVAGVAQQDFDLLVAQISDHYQWDFLLLQEAFARTDAIDVVCSHTLLTGRSRSGCGRSPAVLVHERWDNARSIADGDRWVAVEVNSELVLVSLHLPHKGIDFGQFVACLLEVDSFLEGLQGKQVYIGMDANTRVRGAIDFLHVGSTVEGRSDAADYERCELLYEFLCKHRLMLANTFSDPEQRLHTRTSWAGDGQSQIDFVAVPLSACVVDAFVDGSMVFSTDHQMVVATVRSNIVVPQPKQTRLCPRCWIPGAGWKDAAARFTFDWQEWERTCESWSQLAVQHSACAKKTRDSVLDELLVQHARASPDDKKLLNRRIWRHRRGKKRWSAKQKVTDAAATGSFPKQPRKHLAIDWISLGNGRDPSDVMHDYFLSIYSLQNSQRLREAESSQHWIDLWFTSRSNGSAYIVDVDRLSCAVRKLKNSKGSPDACPAELYKALPEHALASLASFFTSLLFDLSFPVAWTVVSATLIPKIVGARTLDKFRAIACLPAARKLLGYIWLQTLPQLHFESFQCGFVPKSHAADGVYVLKRAIELSREWGQTLFLVQLDLTKAFDKVLHSAVARALRLQSASLQCVAVICAILRQSTIATSLGHVRAAAIDMQRGLPQGAPESPLIFTLVTELVLRPLLGKWKRNGMGWFLDLFSLCNVCYADDIVLASKSKESLELMLSDVITSFKDVGLDVSYQKCHWTSFPNAEGTFLRCGSELLPWSKSLTFVGTIISACANDGDAILHRQAVATKVFYKWRPMLLCKDVSVSKRMMLFYATVFAAYLWLAEVWLPTVEQRGRMNSWAARLASQIVGVPRHGDDAVGEFWKRLHRVGHHVLSQSGGSADACRRRRLHAFAGHVARADDTLPSIAMRTRSLQLWRAWQRVSIFPHPARFKPWRWEEQLTSFYGESWTFFLDESTGWMARAQDRLSWKRSELSFSLA